jgi:MFS family permease
VSVAGIDSTVVAVALPAIGRNLHAGFQDLQWTVTGYTLTLASLILLAGWLPDQRPGRRGDRLDDAAARARIPGPVAVRWR